MVLSFSANYWYQLWQAQKTKSDSTVQSLICTSDLWTGSAPAHTTTIALLRLWPTTHVTPATLPASTQAQHSFTAGILQAPEATHGCRVKVSYCCTLPSQQQRLPHSAFHLLPSQWSAIFPCKCHFQTFSLKKPQRLLAFLTPSRLISVVIFHKRASSIPLAQLKTNSY